MIRPFEPTDVNQCVQLAQQHCEEVGAGIGTFNKQKLIELIKQLNIKPHYQIYVSERQQQIKGYVVCCAVENLWNGMREGHINFLFVHPDHRQGFMAKDLLASAEQWFRSMDCVYFNANTRAWNEHYQANEDFLDSGDAFFSKMMNRCGSNYVKEIH